MTFHDAKIEDTDAKEDREIDDKKGISVTDTVTEITGPKSILNGSKIPGEIRYEKGEIMGENGQKFGPKNAQKLVIMNQISPLKSSVQTPQNIEKVGDEKSDDYDDYYRSHLFEVKLVNKTHESGSNGAIPKSDSKGDNEMTQKSQKSPKGDSNGGMVMPDYALAKEMPEKDSNGEISILNELSVSKRDKNALKSDSNDPKSDSNGEKAFIKADAKMNVKTKVKDFERNKSTEEGNMA